MIFLQAFIPFIGGPLYNLLYKSTVASFPAAFIFVVIGIKALVLLDVVIVYIAQTRVQKKKKELELLVLERYWRAKVLGEQSNLMAEDKTFESNQYDDSF